MPRLIGRVDCMAAIAALGQKSVNFMEERGVPVHGHERHLEIDRPRGFEEPTGADSDVRVATFKDPEGNLIQLLQFSGSM